MVIQDFSVGQRVTILGDMYRGETEKRFATVTRVDRRSIYAVQDDFRVEKRYRLQRQADNHLVEDVDFGRAARLFATEQEADEFLEIQDLQYWFFNAIKGTKINRFRLEQLREVKRIMEGS